MKFCSFCGGKIESETAICCGQCGEMIPNASSNTVEQQENTQENNPQNSENINTNERGGNNKEEQPTPVQQVTVEKGIFLDGEGMDKLARRKESQYYSNQYMQRPQMVYPKSNIPWVTIIIIVTTIGLAIGGYFYYQYWQEQKRLLAEEERFQEELADFCYEFETQWEMLIANTKDFKEKCDNVYNKQNKDMSLQDKLHNIKTETVAYRKSLETIKTTLDKIKMSDRLTNYNDLGDFLNDLLVAVNTNMDYCDNVINLCGNPKEAKKEAQNKGQDTENSYLILYRNKEFKKYFGADLRIDELDSIGGQVEKIADDRVKEMETNIAKNNEPVGISITINGKSENVPPPPGFGNYTPSYNTAPSNNDYLSKMRYLIDAYLDAREATQNSISKARLNKNLPVFKNECLAGANTRYSIAQQAQALQGMAPSNYAKAHQEFINCCYAGYTACQKAYDGVDGYGSNWYEIFSTVSDSNTTNMKYVSDTYQVW